jgi:hypothetical protein
LDAAGQVSARAADRHTLRVAFRGGPNSQSTPALLSNTVAFEISPDAGKAKADSYLLPRDRLADATGAPFVGLPFL